MTKILVVDDSPTDLRLVSASLQGRGYTILTAAGGVNIAATLDAGAYTSFDLEQLIAAHPDILAYAGNVADTPGLNTELAQHPLIRKLANLLRATLDYRLRKTHAICKRRNIERHEIH